MISGAAGVLIFLWQGTDGGKAANYLIGAIN